MILVLDGVWVIVVLFGDWVVKFDLMLLMCVLGGIL